MRTLTELMWNERCDCSSFVASTMGRLTIKDVIYNPPATIVFWMDGTKTVVRCGEYDNFDCEKGLAMAIAKKALGNKGSYYKVFRENVPVGEQVDKFLELKDELNRKLKERKIEKSYYTLDGLIKKVDDFVKMFGDDCK